MGIALDFAAWFDDVAAQVDSAHAALAGRRPPDGSPGFDAWQKQMLLDTDLFGRLTGAAMTLRNVDAQEVMARIGPQLDSIKDQTRQARDVIARIADINAAMELVAAIVTVAASAAALAADPIAGAPALIKSGKALEAALKPFEPKQA